MFFSSMASKRADGSAYVVTAFFALPDNSTDELAFGGVSFDPCYLRSNFFPEMLAGSVNDKSKDQTGNQLAMMIYRSDTPEGKDLKPIVTTAGWDEGKPEVTRKMDDVFRGLSLAIKYQGVSVEALGATWMRRSFLILGFLSIMIIAGLVLTKHMVGKEMAVAKLKSDFVSNVSHELRTPLALIRLYAETLELGRITTKEKKQQYYRIVRKESERLTALINNILDFSRIEAGRKEYEFRETDIANLVRNTKGSGLGLSLVRHITEAHGGDISVESAPGAGSKFTLSLPLMVAPDAQPIQTPATVH